MSEPEIFAERYRLVAKLGQGGMGVVYDAVQLTTGARVAIKTLTGVELSSEAQKRFIREAQAAGRIDSPHVVRVFDMGVDAATGASFIAMERLSGGDGASLLRACGALPTRIAAKIAAQAALGLARAHEQGIVHRDIKPANLYLAHGEADDITVKLLDFGIAKVTHDALQDSEEGGLTRTGNLVGSPHYMSPEQAKGLKTIDHRADIWSLGIVLYKMLTGKTPHANVDTLGQIILAICSEPPAPIQREAPWVPAPLARVVGRCLERDPAARYQSARELFDDLMAFTDGDRALRLADLRTVDDAERGQRADLLVTGDATQHAIELQPTPATTKAARWPLLLGAAAVLLVGAGVWAWRARESELVPVAAMPQASAPVAVAVPVESSPVVAPIASQEVALAIVAPTGAQVFVDGAPVTMTDRTVVLRGLLGSVHQVRVLSGRDEKTETVVISADGAKPSKISMSVPRGHAPGNEAPRPPRSNPPANGDLKARTGFE